MSFKPGRLSSIWLNGKDVSAWLYAMRVSTAVGTKDVSTFGPATAAAAWSNWMATDVRSVASFSGYYDYAMSTITDSLEASTAGVVSIGPGGQAIGDPMRLIQAFGTAYEESAPQSGITGFNWAVGSSARTGFGVSLHPFGEDTNTTTGAWFDGLAASTTGAIAHLHVSLVDGGSWVVKLQDATSSGGAGVADIAGGAFTAVTNPPGANGAQRLVIPGTIRQFVRYVATRTGGSAGDGVTFGLAMART